LSIRIIFFSISWYRRDRTNHILRLLLSGILPYEESMRRYALLLLSALALGAFAGEDMPPPPAHWKIPPAPVVPADQVMSTFKLQSGYKLELVAIEPMVEKPVALSWDGDGRMFVAEMRAYMHDPLGTGEDNPTGRVSMLVDTDGDGKLDQSTIFVDNLVMPRAVMCVAGGVLIAEPPVVWFCKDTNGDGKADVKEKAWEKYAKQENPEHQANGLMWGMDNWIYSANHNTRYKFVDGKFIEEPSRFRGQWGLTQDDVGRLYYNSNSDQLRTDQVDAAYFARNPNLREPKGLTAKAAVANTTWPARINPGVNRGYNKTTLRPDGTLASFTATCGPGVYRGDVFPQWVGDVFICEPAGNFVRHAKASEKDGVVMTENAYKETEFIGGLDERFRPVNCYTGPDGALYIVDMYQGLLQHRMFLTPFLRDQAIQRGLEKPPHLGRIYRVVPDKGKVANPSPKLEKATVAELVEALSHANGWRRDTAQRLLVERQDKASLPLLRKAALEGKNPLGRMQALYALNGLGDADPATLTAALGDKDARVRVAALRASEPLLSGAIAAEWITKVAALGKDADARVRMQTAFSLGAATEGKADAELVTLLLTATDGLLCDAIATGLRGREFQTLTTLCAAPAFAAAKPGAKEAIMSLAGCVIGENKPGKISATLSLAASQTGSGRWRAEAILDGLLAAKPKTAKPGSITLKSAPDGWKAVTDEPKLADRAKKIGEWIAWSGEGSTAKPVEAAKLSPAEQKRFDAGKVRYQTLCFACHQMNGQGLAGLAPPLAGSEWVEGPDGRLARIIMHGVKGEITAAGVTFNLEMPGLGAALDDEAIAEIMTYVRNEWGNRASTVDTAAVKAVRTAEAKRGDAWTAEELLKIK
jgi:mono/diheme cytochrome c family protein/glucose/arabinose dehydrogenase